MASVRDTNIAETLLTAMKELEIAEIEALWLSRIKIWGVRITSESSIFSVDCRGAFYAVLCLYCCVTGRT